MSLKGSATSPPYGEVVASRLVPHLTGLGTTIFAEMSALATSTGAINLGQGFPDVDGPPSIARAAAEAVEGGKGNQYPPGLGIPELRAAIAQHQRQYGLSLDVDSEVLVTAGATEGIAAAMLAFVDTGDEVLALEPFYDSYRATIAMARGRCVPVRLQAPDFRLDVERLHAAITPKTKLILLNSPHNPTGMVLTTDELKAIADVAIEHDLIVVSDEVYEHLTFDAAHTPIATLPGMRERTVTLSSAGKSFSFTGWKVGWATGPADLIGDVRTTKQFLTFVSAGPFQYAVTHALTHEMDWVKQLSTSLADRRDQLCDGLSALGMKVFRPAGTYFVTTDVGPLGFDDAMTFCRELPHRCGVVAVPCSVFYDTPGAEERRLVRWTFSKQESVLADALHRLTSLTSGTSAG